MQTAFQINLLFPIACIQRSTEMNNHQKMFDFSSNMAATINLYENVWLHILWFYFERHNLNFTRHLSRIHAYGFLIKNIRTEPYYSTYVSLKHACWGDRRAFLLVHNLCWRTILFFFFFLQECMKTKHNIWRSFRKLKCLPRFHKIHAVLQNATRILNIVKFMFRH